MLETNNNGSTSVTHSSDPSAPFVHIRYASRCHPGVVRSENQDRVFHSSTPLGELFLVADGVGGHTGGALAAEVAVREYSLRLQSTSPSTPPDVALAGATDKVNEEIARLGGSGIEQRYGQAPVMASTVVLALVQQSSATIGHLGDSRAFLFRAQQLILLTRDHSVVQRMMDAGILSYEQAKSHPNASVLTRCLGQIGSQLELNLLTLETDDVLLLCSDGLWAYLPEGQLAAILAEVAANPAATADALLAAVLTAGAPDNVGFIVLQLQPVDRML